MAMTKKEQAAMKEALDRAELLAALRWTHPVPFDVPIPLSGVSPRAHTEGWVFNAYANRVERGWSESFAHGYGPYPGGHSGTRSAYQGPRKMHSTKVLALMAMRHEVEQEAARRLMAIDRQIAEEKGGA